jgi:hypothetical protein
MMLIFRPLDVGQKNSSIGRGLPRFGEDGFLRGATCFTGAVRRLAFLEAAMESPESVSTGGRLSPSPLARQSKRAAELFSGRIRDLGGAGRPQSTVQQTAAWPLPPR